MGCEEGWVGSQEREGSNRDDQGCSGVEYVWGGPRTQGFGAMAPQWPSNRVYFFPPSSETRPLFSKLYLLCLPN